MKKCLIALAFAALVSPALAADVIPVKAAPAIGYPFISNGFYAGLGAVGDVAGTNVFGSTVYQAGAAVDLTAGYQWAWAGGANWSALEASFQYTNVGASQACLGLLGGPTCTIKSQYGTEQRALFGFPVNIITGLLPNLGTVFPALPALPTGVVTTAAHPYIWAGALERQVNSSIAGLTSSVWTIQPEIGMGIRNQWTQGLVVDTSTGCTVGNAGFALGGVLATALTTDCRAKVAFYY